MKFIDLDTGKPIENEYEITPLPKPSVGDSASVAIQQAGLGIIGQAGSAARIVGDIFGATSLSQWGRDLNLNAKQASEELIPLGEGSVQSVMREAGVNTAMSLPALVSGGLLPALTIMGGQSYLDGYAKAKDGGLSTGRAHLYAGIDAIFETATEAWSLPVLFKTGVPVIKQSMEFLSKELMGEEITTIGQKMNELLQLRPEMTVKEYWGELKQAMIDTAVVTPPTALMQFGIGKGVQMARKATSGTKIRVEGEPEGPGTVPSAASPGVGYPDIQGPPLPSGPGLGGTPGMRPPNRPEATSAPSLPNMGLATEDIRRTARSAMIPEGPQLLQLPAPNKLSDPTPMPDMDGMQSTTLQPIQPADPADPSPEVTIPVQTASLINAAIVPTEGPQAGADTAALTVQPPSIGSVFNNYQEYTPDEIAQQDQPDLRLFQGLAREGKVEMVMVRWNGQFSDEFSGRLGAWEIRTTNKVAITDNELWESTTPGNRIVEQDYAVARTLLENMTGQKLTPDFIKQQHRLLTLRDAISTAEPLTQKQLAYYGEAMGRIRDKAAFVRDELGYMPASGSAPFSGFSYSLGGPNVPSFNTPQVVELETGQTVHLVDDPLPAKVVLAKSAAQSPTFKKMAKLVEAWAKKYKVDGSFVLAPETGPNEHSSSIRSIRAKHGRVYQIYIKEKGSAIHDLNSLAHEFGHVLIWDTVLKFPDNSVLQLTERWLDSVSELAPHTTNFTNARIANTGGAGVATSFLKFDKKPEGVANKYTLSFDEFGANQVAQHLMDNNYFSREPGLKALIEEMRRRIEEFFSQTAIKYSPNKAFKDFLDELAGVGKGKKVAKATPTLVEKPKSKKTKIEKTAAGATVKHKTSGSQLNIPPRVNWFGQALTSGPDPAAAAATEPEAVAVPLSKKEAVLLRAQLVKKLKAAGLWDSETSDAIDPDLKTDTFDFKKAKELLEAAGLNPDVSETVGETAREPLMVDEPDTYELRHGLMNMAPKVEGMTQTMKEKMADSALSVRNFGRMWRSTLTALQVRKLYGGKVPGVKTFVDGLQAMAAYANKIRRRAEGGLELMVKVGNDQRNRVFTLMLQEAQDEKYYNKPEDFLRAGLDAGGVQLYNTMREDYKYALQIMKNLAHKSLLEDFGVADNQAMSPEKAANLKAEQDKIEQAFAKMEAVPYYPHTRFGDYYAAARTKEGLIAFTQAETIEEVRKFTQAMKDEGIDAWYGEMPESVKPLMNMPYQVFEMMKAKLGLSPSQLSEFDDILKNLAPEQSFIRKFQKRKNIEGWENAPEYGPRVYADYFTKFANYAARRWHSAPLDAAIKATRGYKKDMYGMGNSNMLMIDRLINWMEETKEYAMRPDIAAANIRAAVTLWYLGAVPKSAVVNAFSVPLMTLPWLGKRYGDLKAVNALKQSYTDVGKMWFKKDSLSKDEREFFNWLEEVGVADQSYASTMAGVREGGRLMDSFALDPRDWTDAGGRRVAVKSAAYNIKYWSMYAFHRVEVMNRLVSGLAAYRMAKAEMGATGDSMSREAAEIAKDCVQDTQNENQQWNRPELMRGKKSLLTLFMSYTQNAMFQMYGGDQSWQRMLALQLAIAGLMGLPLAKNLDDVIQWFAKEVFGTKTSLDMAIRDYLQGTIVNPEWVLRGASYNMLGTGVNIQSSLSMGNLIPGIDALVLEGTFHERLANAASDVGGAGAAVVMNFMQAMADDSPDSLKAWSRTLPTQAKNLFEGYRMITKGTVSDAAGDPIMNVSGYEGTAKLLGFQSSNVSSEREKRFSQKQMVQYWMTRRKMVFDLHELAEQTGDVKIDLEADKALDKFNEEVPDDALAIKRGDLKRAMQQRARNADKKLDNQPTQRSARELYEQVGRRYSTE